MNSSPAIDRWIGALLCVTTVLVILLEWRVAPTFAAEIESWLAHAAAALTVLVMALLSLHINWKRRIFVMVGLALLAAALLTRADWLEMTEAALRTSAFIAAFFTALTMLRNASASSEAIATCGRFLAEQPPGRRYAALTAGGHLFGLTLNYGAIMLLGALAEPSAKREPNPEIRAHRIRRMLLAVQRGFVSTLPWSPLSFAMAISTTIVAGSSWAKAVAPCLVSGAILALLGWALDSIFKPRLSQPSPPRAKAHGSWASLAPLLILLSILVVLVGGLHVATGVSAVAVAMPIAPLVAFGWIAAQNSGRRPLATAVRRAGDYLTRELPQLRSEMVLLVMAGFIGSLGGHLLSPLMLAAGFDLSTVPPWAILVALVWLIPLSGQIGMNPILTVALFGPLLPDAAAMGVTPTAVIMAITAGWALSGASSPYTATTLMVGALGGVSATHVGLVWNGLFTLLGAVLLSAWAVIYAFALS